MPHRERMGTAMLALWLAGWSTGIFAFVTESLDPRLLSLASVAGTIVFVAVGLAALGVIAWQLIGREALDFTANFLTHRWSVAGIGLTHKYRIERMRHFRAVPWVEPAMKTQYDDAAPGALAAARLLASKRGRTVQVGASLRR